MMLASLIPWRVLRLEFVEPRLEDDEFEKETDEEREQRLIDAGLHTGVAELKYRPLLFSRTPPEVRDRWWYVRRADETEYIAFYVGPDDEFAPGNLEWAGPLPSPYEPGMPRRVRRP